MIKSSRSFVSRLIWVLMAMCVLAACGFLMVNNAFRSLPPLWRLFILVGGWILTFLLILRALPGKNATATNSDNSNFPSPALRKIMDAQEAMQVGFVALDSHARVVISNPFLGKLVDIKEASENAGFSRALHPDNAHVFRNAFQEICQSSSRRTALQLRSFDRAQQIHYLHATWTRWKEPPVAVIGMLWDVSDVEQAKQEAQTVKGALHDFQGVFAADGSTLLDTMRAILELGKLHFKTEIGLVAKLQGGGSQHLEIIQVLASHEELSRGDILNPSAPNRPPFPQILAHTAFVCGDPEAPPPPVYKATRQGTFLGAPIYLQRHLFGVLCFASPQERPEGFSSSEIELIQFIANWLGGEINRHKLIEDSEQKQKRLREANTSLETLLRNDLLTGLFNKTALEDRLEQEFERARIFNLPLSVLTLALDNDQDYRKTQGEDAWRNRLEQLSLIIEQLARKFDTVARYDESTFFVVCPHLNSAEIRLFADDLQKAVTPLSNAPHYKISIGVVSLASNCSDSQQLLAQALGACQLAQLHSVTG